MEPFTSQESIKLVIKTPNQRVKDIEVSCLLDWTVEKLKSHLSTVYPTKPARSSQKIIYSGKLLDDHFVLKDVLQESDGQHQTVHLVCTPSSVDTSTSQQTVPTPPASSSPQITSTPSSTTTTAQATNQPDGLRHRAHAYAQHPFYNMQFGHLPHFAHVGHANPNMGHGHMLPHGFPFQSAHYPGADHIHNAAYNMHIAAQHMAHMHWMQHMAHIMQGNVHNMHQGLPGVQPHIPYPRQNVAQQIPDPHQPPAAVPQMPVAPERQENPAQNRNMVMNANAGGGMMAQNDDDEDNGQRDWLDYLYMFVRIFMLMSIFWFYSSAEKLIIMGLIVFLVWLLQSGVFNLNRAQRNRQPVAQVPANQERAEQEAGDEEGTEASEEIEEDVESDSESLGEDQMDNTPNINNSHPGYLVVGYNFLVTFFTSLVPQAPGAIAQN